MVEMSPIVMKDSLHAEPSTANTHFLMFTSKYYQQLPLQLPPDRAQLGYTHNFYSHLPVTCK